MSYVNIDKALLKKPMNRIARIGVELEGAWSIIPPGASLVGDGSVYPNGAPPGTKKGELPIGPMQVGHLALSLRKYYPNFNDNTCGMHVHMSFYKHYQYALLADGPEYMETIVEYMTRWATEQNLPKTHPIWDRLAGKNRFCLREFWPDKQMHLKNKNYGTGDGSRYTMISYQWERYRTVECRLLPMMATPELAYKAIKQIVNITNGFLYTVGKKIVRERIAVKTVGNGTKLTYRLKKGELLEEFVD